MKSTRASAVRATSSGASGRGAPAPEGGSGRVHAPLRVLLVADYFGKDRSTGTKRANAFAKHWAREPGVTVDVVCARKADYPVDPGWVKPPRVRERRVSWLDLVGLQAALRRAIAPPR